MSWSLSDGGTGTVAQVDHAFDTPGVVTATVTATDRLGRAGMATVAVIVNPTVSVAPTSVPSAPPAGALVAFLSGLSGGASPYTFNWTFGDGSSSAAPAPTHTFAHAGSYTVHLTVTDDLGATATGSFVETVGAAPSTSSGGGSVSLTSGTGLALLLGLLIVAILAVVFAALWVGASRKPPTPPGQTS